MRILRRKRYERQRDNSGSQKFKKILFSGKKRRGREPRAVKALDGVSFSMEYGETLGVVGEVGLAASPTRGQDHTAPS